MNMDAVTASDWFEKNAGKVYARCPACSSSRIAYHKVRRPGLKGISHNSKGLTSCCLDCGKGLPTQLEKEQRHVKPQRKDRRAL